MIENKELLIVKLLRNKIEENQNIIKDIDNPNNSPVVINKELLEKFRNNINTIINMDKQLITDVISELNFYDDIEMNDVENYLFAIKKLLTSNKERGTNYRIYDSQKLYIDKFFDKVDEFYLTLDEKIEESKKKHSYLEEKNNKYIKLLNSITEDRNTDFIDDRELISSLLNECGLTEEEKREVLLEIVKYNRILFEKLSNVSEMSIDIEKLNIDDVVEIFKEFGYDFDKLKPKYKNDILEYGSLDRIREIFEVLKENDFPRFDERRKGVDLTTMLIKSSRKTIESVLNTARACGLNKTDLLKVAPALIIQTNVTKSNDNNVKDKGSKKKRVITSGEINKNTNMFTGHSDDFIKNCEFLSNEGLSVKYILDKCRGILIIDHEKLVNNYRLFEQYGFSFETNIGGDEMHPALSCLLSNNFAEIADAFIEIMPLGYEYIKNNLSKLYTISSADDLIFYNIYKSNMDVDVYGKDIVPEGPFYGDENNLKLSGRITRYKGSGFEDIPYEGITKENKFEKTGTMNLEFENKELFTNSLLDNLNDFVDEDEVLKFEVIRELDDKYRDSDNPYVYDINGVRVSRFKVLRLYSWFVEHGLDVYDNSLLYALTYNSIISEGDFNILMELNNGRRI